MNPIETPWGMFFFSSPALFLICLPVLILLIWQLWGGRVQGAIAISEFSFIRDRGARSIRRHVRIALLAFMTLLVGVFLAEPRLISDSPAAFAQEQRLYKNYMVFLDISGSMGAPLSGGTLRTRYRGAQEAFRSFVANQQNERIGLVLFSDVAYVVTHPTRDMAVLTNGMLDEEFDPYGVSSNNRPHSFQISLFSFRHGGTDISAALRAGEEFVGGSEKQTRGFVFVVLTDLVDNITKLENTIKELRGKDVRIYFIGIGADNTSALEEKFSSDPFVRIFSPQNSQELQRAFGEMEDQERLLDTFTPTHSYEIDMRFWVALLLFATLIGAVVLSERALLIMQGEGVKRQGGR
jgi:Mg-chelatase subunit ChlD